MLYDFVIWAGRDAGGGVLSSRHRGVMLHRSVWHGRSRSAAHRAAPAPPAVHQRRVTTLPAACRTGAAPAPADSSARPRASRPGTRRGPSRWLPRARRDAHERRILAPPRLPGSRATAPRPVSTPRPRRGYGAYGRPGERDGGGCGSASVFIDLSVHAIAVAAV